MKLQIKDRLFIPTFLPKSGNFKQFNIKKDILSKIEVTEKERASINFRENKEDRQFEWDVKKEKPLMVDFTQDEMEYLKMVCESVVNSDLPDELWGVIEKIYNEAMVACEPNN